MVLVNKGTKSKRKLVCTRARAGAGCAYKSVDYLIVESALLHQIYWLLNDAPSQTDEEARLSAEWENNQTDIDLATDHLNNLLEAVEQDLQSPALNERLRKTEAMVEELRQQEAALAVQFKALDKTLLDHKIGRAAAIAEAMPLNRDAFNAALRGLFKAVVIDYPRGELVFHWRGGGTSDVMYAWVD